MSIMGHRRPPVGAPLVLVLVVLGVMAYGERFPFYPPDLPSFTPVTTADRVSLGVLAVGGLALLIVANPEWWRTGVSAVLAVAVVVVVVVVEFGWGREDRRLFLHDPPVSLDVSRAMHTCSERDPVAAAGAFPVGRVPEECRDIWTGDSPLLALPPPTQQLGPDDPDRFTTSNTWESYFEDPLGPTTTTTQLTVESAREDLALALRSPDRRALRLLADAYEAMARSFDTNDQAALIAWNTARWMRDVELVDEAETAVQETSDLACGGPRCRDRRTAHTVARIVSCCGSDRTDQALRASRALSPSTSRFSFRTRRSTYSTAPTAALSGMLRRVTICWV